MQYLGNGLEHRWGERVKANIPVRVESNREAKDHFRRSLDWARRQGALSWKLRAAISLGELQRSEGRTVEARMSITEVYDRFIEGFATADLRSARVLIDELS